MSGRLTIWGAQQLLTSYFIKSATPPSSFWLALIQTIAPTPYLDGSELDEPTVADYARVEINNDPLWWANDSSPQEVYLATDITFNTATVDWGEIRYWALCNAQTDGYNLVIGELDNPVLVQTGDLLTVSEGDLSFSLGPFFLTEED